MHHYSYEEIVELEKSEPNKEQEDQRLARETD